MAVWGKLSKSTIAGDCNTLSHKIDPPELNDIENII